LGEIDGPASFDRLIRDNRVRCVPCDTQEAPVVTQIRRLDHERRVSRGSRVLILRLALRSIRWRAAASATVFVVAVVAILAATVGPIYLHALDETVFARQLKDATLSQRDVLVSRTSLLGYRNVNWDAQVRGLANGVADDHLFAPPLSEQQVDVNYGGREQLKTEVASVEDLCAHVRIIRGRCVSGNSTDETLISANTAAVEHLTVGGTLATTTTSGVPLPLRVVGVYRPVAPGGPFWQPWDLFQFGRPVSGNQPPPGDASFVTPAALASWARRVSETFSANVALVPKRVGYDDTGELRSTIAQANAGAARLIHRAGTSGVPVAAVTTSLPTVLNETAHETSLARTLVTIATAQLALLAIFLLYAVVANTTRAQGPEVALAKLRGRRTGSVLLQSVAQPVTLVLAAAPVAAVLAWLVVRLLAPRLLGHSVVVVFPPAAYGIAALAVAGGILAAVVAAYRIVVTPVGVLMRRGAALPGSPIGLLVADAAAVTLAVAGLIELEVGGVLNSGKPNPLSVLAPTLLAIAAAVVVLRLLPFPLRGLARWTRDSPRLATFLTVRQLLRRPDDARPVLLVAVALSIAAFAVTNWTDARHNRSLRALNATGAHTVLIVRPGAGIDDLRTAVDRADPSGQSMAVAYTNVDGLPPMIAVDTARFASVGAWVTSNASVPLASVLHRLAGGRAAPVTVTGTRLRLRIDLIRHPTRTVQLAVSVIASNHEQALRTVARILPGTGTYAISLPSACARGCHVAALALTANTPGNPDAVGTHVNEIDALIGASVATGGGWRPVPSFGDHARWRGDGKGQVALATAGASLSLDVRQVSGDAWPSAVSASIPNALPGVVASGQAAVQEGNQIHRIEAVGLDRQSVFVNGLIRAVTLPQVDRDGVMVDFGAALAAMSQTVATTTQYQVWLSSSAPSDIAARLAHLHVYVLRTIHSATVRSALDNSGPAFADSLFLIAALAAVVLAIGATAFGRVLSVRRRSYELAALEVVGVSPRTLRRAMAAEQGTVLGIGLIVGLAAGLIGSRLALSSTPVFVDTSTGPPLVLDVPWGLVAALTVGLVIVFVVVSVVIARLVERAAEPNELRGAQQ
jgi:putative ABC transport system permease protein